MRRSSAERLFLIAVITTTGFAQLSTAQTNVFTIEPGAIIYYGSANDLDCSVHLRLTGDCLSNVVAIPEIRLGHAVDDTGKDLRKSSLKSSLRLPARPAISAGFPTALTAQEWYCSLELKCPAESARSIRSLEGEIDLAIPTASNGGRIVVNDFMGHPGRVIANPALARFGVQLIYHTLESYTDYQRAHPTKYVDPSVLKVEELCFSGIYGNPTNPTRKTIAIQVTDAQRKLLGIFFETVDARPLRVRSHATVGGFQSWKFEEPPASDSKLVVTVSVPGVIQTKRFSLKNIRLPWDHLPSQSQTPKSAVAR